VAKGRRKAQRKGQQIFEPQFFTTNLDLDRRFTTMVTAFNNHNINAVAGFLDVNVALNTLTPPHLYQGKNDVVTYLTGKFNDPAVKFYPLTTTSGVATGTVSGTALWHDHDTVDAKGNNIGEKIQYGFIFVQHLYRIDDGGNVVQDDGQWYCVNLWGTSP
jgi:hypothetical protein